MHSFVKCLFQDMPTIFFIEIRSYLTDIEQKESWHVFIEIRCRCINEYMYILAFLFRNKDVYNRLLNCITTQKKGQV